VKSNYASYWTHGIVDGVKGKQLEASIKFLKYITSPEVQELWLQRVGELPATPSLSEKYKDDPFISPFLKGLAYAKASLFIDEAGQRNVMVDAVDEVYLKKVDPLQALKNAAAKEQKLIDNFWK
jgi:multiple sugar transport system substrate-binding protein